MRRCCRCGRRGEKKATVGRRKQKLEEEEADLKKSRQKARSDFLSAKRRLENLRSVQDSVTFWIKHLCDSVNANLHALRHHPEGREISPDLSHDLHLAMVKACAEAGIPVPAPIPGPAPAPPAPGQE